MYNIHEYINVTYACTSQTVIKNKIKTEFFFFAHANGPARQRSRLAFKNKYIHVFIIIHLNNFIEINYRCTYSGLKVVYKSKCCLNIRNDTFFKTSALERNGREKISHPGGNRTHRPPEEISAA